MSMPHSTHCFARAAWFFHADGVGHDFDARLLASAMADFTVSSVALAQTVM
jgi:hypothetical protein